LLVPGFDEPNWIDPLLVGGKVGLGSTEVCPSKTCLFEASMPSSKQPSRVSRQMLASGSPPVSRSKARPKTMIKTQGTDNNRRYQTIVAPELPNGLHLNFVIALKVRVRRGPLALLRALLGRLLRK
jgi:hypothetical protein